MNALNNLKLVCFDRAGAGADSKTQRRSKLAAKITEQIAAARADGEGVTYTRTDSKRRVRHWFRAIDEKRWAVMLFYGSKQLELAKGKNAAECAGLQGVIGTLETLRAAVLAGELDAQIGTAADALKRGFKKQ